MFNILNLKLNPSKTNQRGALLLELLVAVSLLAVILSVGSESVYVSMQSGKTSSENDVAVGLASETLEAVRAITDERWQNIYDLIKESPYYPVQANTKWETSPGSEEISLNTANYTRDFIVQDVCRDDTTREITSVVPCTGGSNDDPSTQKITVTVSWNGAGSPVIISDYFLRWRNKVCVQTDWSGGALGGTKNCPDTSYGSIEPVGTIDTSAGSLKLQ